MAMQQIKGRLWLGFGASILVAFTSGIDLAFNTYATTLKETFNYTQTQVELVASFGTLGWVLSGLETTLTHFCGFRVTCITVTITIPLSSGMFALAVNYKDFFHETPSLICLFQLMLSTCNYVGFVAVTRVCVENFPSHHSGKLFGLYTAVCCFGKVFLAGLMELLEGNLQKFFLTFCVMSFIFTASCMVILYPMFHKKKTPDEFIRFNQIKWDALKSSESKLLVGSNNDVDNSHTGETDVRDVIRSPFFHAVFWSSGMAFACGSAALNNITTVSLAMGTEQPLNLVYFMSLSIMAIRLMCGAILDRVGTVICGLAVMIVNYCVFASGLIVAMFWMNANNITLVAILLGIGMAPMATVPIIVLLSSFGRSHYSLIFTSYTAVDGVGAVVLQYIIGRLYDMQSDEVAGSTFCYGRNCFFMSFLILLVIILINIVISIALCMRTRCR